MLKTLITISRDPINNKLNAASGILSLRHLVKSFPGYLVENKIRQRISGIMIYTASLLSQLF